ncbi:hypothetical protein JYB62_18800 [Algoriphagus lutimaris]|uniref:nSTAND1 domain-containing NTPase n=1 Tax=Algoriphagus lutimaris TaxID=613197 RepID=UPI00196AC557|nr:hypothetical protein [Algoriphagus lutimaris]MBN3522061.1 hypothetical protein [Algoriphagus lutimaris]
MEKHYRYPGTRPFQEDDRNLFFGRNEDIKKLTELIVLEKMVVLFSKSGFGKSSLLNAGVIPRLKEVENFQTLNIRFNDPERNPVELLSFHLENKKGQNTFLDSKFNILDELPDDISAKLWYYAKSIQIAQRDSIPMVLIFDQFEELFNYSPSQVKDFASELATLLNPNLLVSIRSLFKQKIAASRDYFTKEETDLLLEPLNLKVVFSLRSDRISLLNQLKDSIPAVFKKTYELQSLNEAQAREALLEPAGKAGDYASPQFYFSKDAQDRILNSLIDKEKKRIETFQLQLICQHAEEKIIQKQKDHPNSTHLELTAEELGKPEDLFEEHYNTIIGSLPEESQHKARILIEDKLIIGGNRVPLPESVIITEYQIPEELLKTLVDKRLLRSEPNTVGGTSFELSHDTLVDPIQKTAKIRREEEARKQAEIERFEKAKIRSNRIIKALLVISISGLVLAVFLGYQAFSASNLANAQRIEAETQRIEAEKQKEIAEASREEAIRIKQRADLNREIAITQKMLADSVITETRRQFANYKALLLKSTAINLMAKSKNTEALRVAEAAYASALQANPEIKEVLSNFLLASFFSNYLSQILKFNQNTGDIFLAFSSDGKSLLAGNDENTEILWNLNGKQSQTLQEHADSVSFISFTSDGTAVLTGSGDRTAIFMKTASGIYDWLQSPECQIRQLTEKEKKEYWIIVEEEKN